MTDLGFKNIPVRFFIYSDDCEPNEYDDTTLDIIEVDETLFLQATGEIEYERHTVFENGSRQICLTKRNGF